jgi:uncharacterized short protein YbdD (DUF466 family)
MTKTRNAWGWAVKAARLMVGIPDYETYVQLRRKTHPDELIMSYEAFYRKCMERRYAVEKGRFPACFKACC